MHIEIQMAPPAFLCGVIDDNVNRVHHLSLELQLAVTHRPFSALPEAPSEDSLIIRIIIINAA